MNVKNMRWGYIGCGTDCEPESGNTIVEICVTDERQIYFVIVNEMEIYQHAGVSPLSMFDILMHIADYDVDEESEYEKYTSNVIEDYDYEIGDEPDEMYDSKFVEAIYLARAAIKAYSKNDDGKSDIQTAMEFIEPYLDKDIDEIDLPDLDEDEDSDEDEY